MLATDLPTFSQSEIKVSIVTRFPWQQICCVIIQKIDRSSMAGALVYCMGAAITALYVISEEEPIRTKQLRRNRDMLGTKMSGFRSNKLSPLSQS